MNKFSVGDLVWYMGEQYIVKEVRGLRGESVVISDEDIHPLNNPVVLDVDEMYLTFDEDWDEGA